MTKVKLLMSLTFFIALGFGLYLVGHMVLAFILWETIPLNFLWLRVCLLHSALWTFIFIASTDKDGDGK